MPEFPSFDLTRQVALVTGAARGLGRAISLALAHAGADVALGFRGLNRPGDALERIGAMGRKALPLQMDTAKLEQIHDGIENVVQRFGRIDLLVNNTGIAPVNMAENVTEEDFDRTLAVNLKGTFFACQYAG